MRSIIRLAKAVSLLSPDFPTLTLSQSVTQSSQSVGRNVRFISVRAEYRSVLDASRVPSGPLSGLRQLPDRRSGGAAIGGPGGLGGGNSSASERGGNPGGSQGRDRDSDPRRAGSEANSSDHEREGGIGRKEHQLLADKVEKLTTMMEQVASKVLGDVASQSDEEESPHKGVQFTTPNKKKKRKKGRRNRSKDESSELNSSESESSSSGSSVGSFRTPAGTDKNKRAQELERSWEDKLTHLEPEDRATLLFEASGHDRQKGTPLVSLRKFFVCLVWPGGKGGFTPGRRRADLRHATQRPTADCQGGADKSDKVPRRVLRLYYEAEGVAPLFPRLRLFDYPVSPGEGAGETIRLEGSGILHHGPLHFQGRQPRHEVAEGCREARKG